MGNVMGERRVIRLVAFLAAEAAAGKEIFPAPELYFAALDRTALPAVKVVILGQDPYPRPGMAHGLAFSVATSTTLPPSLQNVLKEYSRDTGLPIPAHGNLGAWADRGVLLLNAALTVEHGVRRSHKGSGWSVLTNRVVSAVNDRPGHVAFILWGDDARRRKRLIDASRHAIIESSHPSNLSASKGFHGSGPFTAANRFLRERGVEEINWSLEDNASVGKTPTKYVDKIY